MLISLSNGTFQLRSSPLTTIMWGSGDGGTELCLSQTEDAGKPSLVQEAPFSVSVVSRTVACCTGEAPMHGEGSPALVVCTPLSLWISTTITSSLSSGVCRSVCLHGFTEWKKMFWGIFLWVLWTSRSRGWVQGVPEPREGCTDPPTCSCCSSASEGKLRGTKIQKGHKCLWNKLECTFPMDPSCCCGRSHCQSRPCLKIPAMFLESSPMSANSFTACKVH